MSGKELLVAVDRSPSRRLRATLYSIVVSPINCQGRLSRLRDKFKEACRISRTKRVTYFTSKIKIITSLVKDDHIILLEVSKHLHNITRIAKRVSDKVIVAVIDDAIYNTFSNNI